MLPSPGIAGSAESKARAKAWKAAIKAHGKAKRISLAIAGDADANAALDGEASYALQHAQSKKRAASDDWHPRPRGSAPEGYSWDHARGKWIDKDGDPRSTTTRNERRVEQRDASSVITGR